MQMRISCLQLIVNSVRLESDAQAAANEKQCFAGICLAGTRLTNFIAFKLANMVGHGATFIIHT